MLLPDSCLRFDNVFASSSWSYDAVGVHHADHHRCLIHGNSLNGFIFFLYVLSKYFVLFDGRYRFTSYWVQEYRVSIFIWRLEPSDIDSDPSVHVQGVRLFSAAMPGGHGEEQTLPRPLYSESGHVQGTESKKTYCEGASHTHTSETKLIDLMGNRFLMVDQPGTEKRCDVNIYVNIICKHL